MYGGSANDTLDGRHHYLSHTRISSDPSNSLPCMDMRLDLLTPLHVLKVFRSAKGRKHVTEKINDPTPLLLIKS